MTNKREQVKREVTFILPMQTNEGESLTALHYDLQDELIDLYYGYTYQEGFGGYKSDNMRVKEKVGIYKLAITQEQEDGLRTIIAAYGKFAGQECMYYINLNGEVEFIA